MLSNLIIFLNKKLHILFLSGWYPSRVLPSNGDFVQRHAEAVATKHKVTLIHVVTDDTIIKKEHSTKLINNVLTKIIYVPKVSNPVSKFISFFNAYLREIDNIGDFDLTHLNITYPKGIIALYLKIFKKKPYIISEHWSDYQAHLNNAISFTTKTVTKFIVKNAAFVCPVTTHLQKSMIDFGLIGCYKPIPNVVNLTNFNLGENNTKEFVVTHVSGMDDEIKNVSGILNAVSQLQKKIPNLKFNLIGSNSNKFNEVIKKLGLNNYTIIDQISNIEVAEYLKKSDVFVLFSNYENLPCVIIESFACGVPVISTNVGGISEYFPKDFGFLIPPKDEIELKKSILKIYHKEIVPNKAEMHTYAKNKFGINSICNEFTKLYLQTLNP